MSVPLLFEDSSGWFPFTIYKASDVAANATPGGFPQPPMNLTMDLPSLSKVYWLSRSCDVSGACELNINGSKWDISIPTQTLPMLLFRGGQGSGLEVMPQARCATEGFTDPNYDYSAFKILQGTDLAYYRAFNSMMTLNGGRPFGESLNRVHWMEPVILKNGQGAWMTSGDILDVNALGTYFEVQIEFGEGAVTLASSNPTNFPLDLTTSIKVGAKTFPLPMYGGLDWGNDAKITGTGTVLFDFNTFYGD